MKKGHRLDSIPGFPRDLAQELAQLSIATAEEFLALLEAGESDLRSALPVDAEALDRGVAVARDWTGPEYEATLAQLRDATADDHGFGAKRPTSEEFDEVMRTQEGDQT